MNPVLNEFFVGIFTRSLFGKVKCWYIRPSIQLMNRYIMMKPAVVLKNSCSPVVVLRYFIVVIFSY